MKIYIPTVGRAHEQKTWHRLPLALRKRTTLVIQWRERDLYPDYPTTVLPKNIITIAKTRQWIIDNHSVGAAGNTLCMLDDDLREFGTRRVDRPTLFSQARDNELLVAFIRLERQLSKYAHAGIVAREGADRVTEPTLYATRMMRVLAYHVPTIRQMKIRFDRVVFKEDFDVTLQLLRLGYPNAVIADYMQGQARGSNAPGGCNTYRTPESNDAAAEILRKLHPDFVRVVTAPDRKVWGGTRQDVQIAWKKAFASSGYTFEKPRSLI